MAFAGTMGAAAAMTPIGVLSAPGGALTYAADAVSLLKTPVGSSTPILRPQLDNLRFTMENDQGPVLDVMAVGGPSIANADTGGLATSAPGANEHGIPANFGPGRGNWTQDDVERLRVTVQTWRSDGGLATDIGALQPTRVTLGAGDVLIEIRNMSLRAADGIVLELEYRHSIEIG